MRSQIRFRETENPSAPTAMSQPPVADASISLDSSRSLWWMRGGAIVLVILVGLASDSSFLETIEFPDRLAGISFNPKPVPTPTESPDPLPPPVSQPTPTPTPVPSAIPVSPELPGSTAPDLYQQTYRSVVLIETSDSQGSGSIFRYQKRLLISTNQHVVGDAAVVQVKTVQGLIYEGIVRGKDATTDLAIVEISTPLNLPALPLQTQVPPIGSTVYALGNPIGLEHTFTQGIVSRLDPNTDEIQHSAAIAPGSSGSPLLNDRGEAVGVNRAVFTQFEDLSIAIPAQAVVDLTQHLVQDDTP